MSSTGSGATERSQSGVLVGAMFLAYALNYCDRQAIFSIYPVLRSELGFSNAQLGLIGSAFAFVYGFSSPIAGQMGDRFSQRALVVFSLVLWSLFTLGTGLCSTVAILLACRALVGVTESLFLPPAIALTGSAFPPGGRSRAVGVIKSAQIFGVVAGAWFGGYMADRGHWRRAFFALGTIGLLYAIPYRAALARHTRPLYHETRSSGTLWAALVLVRVPSYLALAAVYLVESFGLWLVYAWLPNFFREKFSLSMTQAALQATLWLQTATFVGILSGGWVADRLCARRSTVRFEVIAWGMLLCVPCLAGVGLSDTLLATKLSALGLGLGTGWVMANVYSSAFDVIPADTRASSVGLLNMFSAIGAGLGTFLGGLLKESLGTGDLLALTGAAYGLIGLFFFGAIRWWFGRDYARVHA